MSKFSPVKLRGENSYDVDEASNQSAISEFDESVTVQEFKDECDINEIVRRFGLTGEMPDVRMPQYGDFDQVVDYHSAMNATREAEENFALLPSKLREKFDNDPGKFVEFCLDDSNYEEAQKLGLVPPPSLVTDEKGNVVDTTTRKIVQPAPNSADSVPVPDGKTN